MGVLFFFVTVRELCVLQKTHASALFLWKQVAQEIYHLHLPLQKRLCDLDDQEVCHLRRHPVLGHELDMLIFVATEQKLHVSPGDRNDHAILAGTQDSSNPTIGIFTGEAYKSKAGHDILALCGSSLRVIPKFFICGREKRIGTSPVSSTSTLVEHGGVVGKL